MSYTVYYDTIYIFVFLTVMSLKVGIVYFLPFLMFITIHSIGKALSDGTNE